MGPVVPGYRDDGELAAESAPRSSAGRVDAGRGDLRSGRRRDGRSGRAPGRRLAGAAGVCACAAQGFRPRVVRRCSERRPERRRIRTRRLGAARRGTSSGHSTSRRSCHASSSLARMDARIDQIEQGERLPGVDELVRPGERGQRRWLDFTARGEMPVEPAGWQVLETTYESLAAPLPLFSRTERQAEGASVDSRRLQEPGEPPAIGERPPLLSPRPIARIAEMATRKREKVDDGLFKGSLSSPDQRMSYEHLLEKEVLSCTRLRQQKSPFAGILEPSDGLEPSTPSLPWRFPGATGGHGRAFAITFRLQIGSSRRVSRARPCPRVPRLMYPSRTRGSLSVCKTIGQHGNSTESPDRRTSG